MLDTLPAGTAPAAASTRDRVIETIARELETSLAAEDLSDRARRLLWMIGGLLRHVIAGDEPASAGSGRVAIEYELAAIRDGVAREAALPLAARSAAANASLAVTAEALTPYLRDRKVIAPTASIATVERLLGGFSKETYLLAVAGDPALEMLILRRDVPLGPVDSTVLDEYPLLLALSRAGFEVAEPLLLETDRAAFAEPFVISRKVAGAATPNTEGLGVKPEQIHAARALATFLGQLHAQDIAALGLGGRWSEPGVTLHGHIAHEIDAIDRSWREHRQTVSPIIATAIDWLRANIPNTGDEPARVVHGDAGLHNLLMDGSAMSVMLDWELAHPGDPTEDLSYCRTWIDQVLGWDDFLALYQAAGGQPYHAERETFYGVLADLRVAVFAVRSEAHVRLSDQPELPIAFGALYYSRIFREKVGARLLAVLTPDGQ